MSDRAGRGEVAAKVRMVAVNVGWLEFKDVLDILSTALCPDTRRPVDMSAYLHYCTIQSDMQSIGSEPPSFDGDRRAALTSSKLAIDLFRSPVLAKTRHGARFTPPHANRNLRGGGSEFHRDQVLLSLLRAGFGLGTKFSLGDGVSVDLASIRDDLLANLVVLPAELPWTAAALSRLLPPKREWRDKEGGLHTLGELATALLSTDLGLQSCGGTHVIDAAAVLLTADTQSSVLPRRVARQLRARMAAWIDRLRDRQLATGAWTLSWYTDDRSKPRSRVPMDEELLVTGHICELALRHRCVDLGVEATQKGLVRLVKLLKRYAADGSIRRGLMCPLTHAIHAVVLGKSQGYIY